MKFEKKALHEALKMVAPFAGTFPVKQTVFGVEKDVMTAVVRLAFNVTSYLVIEAVNNYASTCVFLPIEGQEEHTYVLPVKTLVDVVGAADGDTVEITHTKEGMCVKTQAGKTTFKSLGGNAVPPIRGNAEYTSLGLSNEALARGIGLVAQAAATETARPVLHGVMIEIANKEITLVGTDGFRLSAYTIPTTCEKKMAAIIPLEAISGLVASLSKQAGAAQIEMTGDQVVFSLDNGGMVAALQVDGRYPDWRQIMPKNVRTKLVFDGSLAAAVKTAKVIAKENSQKAPIISMKIGDDVEVRAESAETGSCKVGVTPINAMGVVAGEVISFNANLLPVAEMSEGAKVGLNGPKTPMVWENGKEGWKYVLMPCTEY